MISKNKHIAIVDAEFGNLASIINATKYLRFEFNVLKNSTDLKKCYKEYVEILYLYSSPI